MRKYASPKDRQPEVRTKLPEEIYDLLEYEAMRTGRTIYEEARFEIMKGLGIYSGVPEAR